MKAVWIDAGNDPLWERLAQHGITRLYFPVSDPLPDVQRRLADTKARGLSGGLYSAWNWYEGLSGPEYADVMHKRVKEIAPNATATWPKIQLDDETHDPDRILGLLRRWRQLRPGTDTSWTLECFQGGWMSPEFAAEIVRLKIRVVPQCYVGGMEPVCTLAAARDLTRRGIPDSLVTPFYDAAQLPVGWDGFAFTMGRLPA
jgi:hypothetical protein